MLERLQRRGSELHTSIVVGGRAAHLTGVDGLVAVSCVKVAPLRLRQDGPGDVCGYRSIPHVQNHTVGFFWVNICCQADIWTQLVRCLQREIWWLQGAEDEQDRGPRDSI